MRHRVLAGAAIAALAAVLAAATLSPRGIAAAVALLAMGACPFLGPRARWAAPALLVAGLALAQDAGPEVAILAVLAWALPGWTEAAVAVVLLAAAFAARPLLARVPDAAAAPVLAALACVLLLVALVVRRARSVPR